MLTPKHSPKNNAPKTSKSRCSVHKYRRFSKRNKTYRTDIYYCTECPHYIPIDQIFGRLMECWRCGRAFTFKEIGKFPLKPECGCKNSEVDKTRDEVKNLDWLEERKQLTSDDVLEDLLGMIDNGDE